MTTTAEKFAATFATTERLSPANLHAYQHRALERLARHARSQSPFYTDRLAPLFGPTDSYVPQRWAEVPILTRADAQRHADDLRAREMPPQAGERIVGQTSGSTGRTFRHERCALTDTASLAMTRRYQIWHELDPDARLARITIDWDREAVLPHGTQTPGWHVVGRGECWNLDICGVSAQDQANWLVRVEPDYLLTYPSAALAIFRDCAERGIDLRMKAIITIGEALGSARRQALRAASGARVIDSYGAQEVGLMAIQCPDTNHLHVCAESQVVEILDEDGLPAADGQAGRVVVTPLYNFAMPFIRYDIGDRAVFQRAPCCCGRVLPVLTSVLGRERNMFTFPGNRQIWPQVSSAEMEKHMPGAQYQIAQTGPLEIEFRYVPQSEGQQEDREALKRLLRDCLDSRVTVTVRRMSEIPRLPSGKYEDYVCERPA